MIQEIGLNRLLCLEDGKYNISDLCHHAVSFCFIDYPTSVGVSSLPAWHSYVKLCEGFRNAIAYTSGLLLIRHNPSFREDIEGLAKYYGMQYIGNTQTLVAADHEERNIPVRRDLHVIATMEYSILPKADYLSAISFTKNSETLYKALKSFPGASLLDLSGSVHAATACKRLGYTYWGVVEKEAQLSPLIACFQSYHLNAGTLL